jgi:glycosyltransferase involved in cell wall biosynthesis/peptidoglycan/xylan/chitin deacetylase (PgdA/CDA1 family)
MTTAGRARRARQLRSGTSRLRVLFLIDALVDTGGAERFALGLATHLPRERFEVWMCSTRIQEQVAVDALAAAGVTHLNLARRAKWDVHRFRALLGLLRAERFDVLHSHMFGSNAWGVTFGRACGVPVIVAHEHNWSYSGEPLRVLIDRHVIARLASRIVAVSQSNLERMVEIERIPAEKIVVLPTGYIPHGPAAALDIRQELGLPADSLVVATAANLRVEKALEVLVEAHALLRRDVERAELVLIGDGPCREGLEELAAQLGTSAHVHFLGRREDVDAILGHVDVCAMSSDWEGMPLFAFECMAAAVPLVATAVGGLREIVEAGRTGLLVPPRDPPALATALRSLLADPELRRRIATAAGERTGEFTIDAITRRFAELYEELVAEAYRIPRWSAAESASAGTAPAGAPGAVPHAAEGAATGRIAPARRRLAGGPDVLVLCYHAVSPTWSASLSLEPARLETQVSHLLDRGWQATTFAEAVVDPPARRTLAITFDDAFASVGRHAAPVLARLGVTATVFVVTAFAELGTPLSWPGIEHWAETPDRHELDSLSWDGLRELSELGWEVGSHTRTHARLTRLDDEQLERELVCSREACDRALGGRCGSIAYPYGDVDARVGAAALRAGYHAGAALSRRLAPGGVDRYPRVGIYHNDGTLRFRLKASRATRRLRAVSWLFPSGPGAAADPT